MNGTTAVEIMLPTNGYDKEYRPGWRIKERISAWLRLILSDKDSRNMFMFLILNLGMAAVELFYGILTNSLGLISDSFHMFFDCTALLAGLIAALITRWRANDKFTYGYVRAEVLGGFVNALLLLFISFFIFKEAVERLFAPPHVHHDRLFLVSVIGFLVNLVGMFLFAHGGAHGHSHGGHGHSHAPTISHGHSHNNVSQNRHGHSHNSHGHSHDSHNRNSHGHSHDIGFTYEEPPHEEQTGSDNKIMEGVFLHVLADTLGSVGVIISSGLIQQFGWMVADPICSVFIACLIALSVVPLMRDSISILMQRQPTSLDHLLPGCYKRVCQLTGVYSIHEPHFWTLASNIYTGTVKVEVAMDADSKYILHQTLSIFMAAGVSQMVVQIDTVAG
ncbi:Zinc transporter 7 [Lamellibrachia satsuma]|nr:Zinc transporter 7 [Lamellibrachia satsuma]